MVFLKLGDDSCVDPRSAKALALRNYLDFDLDAGTLKIGRFRDRKMTAKTPKPQAGKATGEADEDLSRDSSIIVAATINGNQCHQEICDFLISRTTGWENFFLREMVNLAKIGAIQKAKIRDIAQRCEQEKGSRRICRYCQCRALIIDEFSYYCLNCGNCLNLDWNGGGVQS